MDLTPNVTRFTGFADCYDTYRPQPPVLLVDLLTQLAQVEKPQLVVDLGCGTGLSTCIWAGKAREVVGVEPSADMRSEAEARTSRLPDPSGISYREGLSSETGLPNGCADIVTASQALHWMEPESTFAEVARILREGGVFAAVDCDWPPTLNWQAEAAYNALQERVRGLEIEHGITDKIRKWSKDEHLTRMRESGRFRYTREILLHNIESGDADRLVGVALSQGSVQTLLKMGLSEEEIGVTTLRSEARRVLGNKAVQWYWSYRVRVGVKC